MGRIHDPAPCTKSGYDPQQRVSILILNLLAGCLLKEASDPNIDCLQLPLFNSINLCSTSSTLHMTEKAKRQESELSAQEQRGEKRRVKGWEKKGNDRPGEREGRRDRQKKRLMRQSGEIEN